jgi:hypothetical protein
MVSASWAVSSNLAAGLVDGLTGLGTWPQVPNVDAPDCSRPAWVQIDLGQIRFLHRVTFWSFYDGRVFCSISVALSSTCMFAGEEITVFSCTSYSTCPTPTPSGYTVSFSGQNARCVRWKSGGSTSNTGVQFLELSVSGGQLSSSAEITARGNSVMSENGLD